MKICHITTVHPRYDIRIFKKECISLAKAGFDVYLLVNDDFDDEVIDGVRIHSLRERPKNRLDRLLRITSLAFVEAGKLDADVYHIHDPELLGMANRLHKQGKKVIFDSHEFTAMQILTKTYLPPIVRKPLSIIYRSYETDKINKLNGLIYPCTFDGKDYFKKVTISKIIIGNYPSKIELGKLYKTFSNKGKELKVCYVGAISESRGIYQMIRACAIAKRKLVLIGTVPEDIYDNLKDMPEFEWVECMGKLSHTEAMCEVAKCSVALSVLQNQGQYAHLDNLPTKLYEYMALGVPAVVSNFPYYEKILKEYKFGIAVDPANEYEIAEAINEIINNDKLQKQLIENGRVIINREMNWEKDAEKLISFYKGLS